MANLCRHPEYVPRCVAHNVFGRKSPADLELPWFAYGAIDFLDGFLKPHMTVCEYGSGGSTLFFARRVKSVHSIEDNAAWHDLVSQRLCDKSIDNVTMVLHPFDFKNPAGFEKSDYLHAIPDEKFDVIVVDGSEEWTRVRPVCFDKAQKHVKKNGIIVVDDSWRYPEIRQGHAAARCEIFQSVGPCRPGVTSTDVYFY
ncbi:MAG TPA: class I SAM-dependent methyltransferase [Verrucomicrobiae bacterium]